MTPIHDCIINKNYKIKKNLDNRESKIKEDLSPTKNLKGLHVVCAQRHPLFFLMVFLCIKKKIYYSFNITNFNKFNSECRARMFRGYKQSYF